MYLSSLETICSHQFAYAETWQALQKECGKIGQKTSFSEKSSPLRPHFVPLENFHWVKMNMFN